MTTFDERREAMVREQLAYRGIVDPAILTAFRAVPRERFVAENHRLAAYEDHPLPIGAGQTISQPYMVALMVAALHLRPTDHVLEVGAGSGYAAAILSCLAGDVVAVERMPGLAAAAAELLADLGFDKIKVVAADGSTGVAGEAPFDAICVSAGAPKVPRALVQQLTIGGRLVVPVGPSDHQELIRIRVVRPGRTRKERLGSVRFVPLVGEQGWQR